MKQSPGETRLETRNLSLDIAARRLINRLDWQVCAGEFWGVLGRNGVGKTTLLETVCGLNSEASNPSEAAILLSGQAQSRISVSQRARLVSLLGQQPEINLWCTVAEFALSGRYPWGPSWSAPTAEDHQWAKRLLEYYELGDKLDRRVSHLSGGELQRLRLVTVLLQDTGLIVLDEPVNHLDLRHQIALLDDLSRRVRGEADDTDSEQKPVAVIAAMHDLNLVRRYCNRVLLIQGDGSTQLGDVDEMMTAENLSELYGHPVKLLRGVNGSAFAPG